MKDDPVIGSIRAVRHLISEEYGHDPKRLVAYYMERQKEREKQQKKKVESKGNSEDAITRLSTGQTT